MTFLELALVTIILAVMSAILFAATGVNVLDYLGR